MENIIIDNFIHNPNKYVIDILDKSFQDVTAGDTLFKGIQVRKMDELQYKVEDAFPNYDVTFNFIRQSPLNQKEPNFIHTDEMMGDKTVLLYLNKHHPMEDGTTLYNFNKVQNFIENIKLIKGINLEPAVCVNVRRADFLNNQEHFPK